MARYYLKKLQKQEMGSPDSSGRTHRGRYIYLSRDSGDFFPHLSQTVLNDTLVLPIIMPFSENRLYAKFVYHNSKYALLTPPERPRNEYRLYLNNEIDQHKALFHVDDIVVIEKVETTSSDTEKGYVYSISIFNSSDTCYSLLDQLISDSPMRGANALVDEKLEFIITPLITESTTATISTEILNIVKEEQKPLIETIENDPTSQIEETKGANLFTSVSFRDFVLYAYGYKCAITGESIRYKNLNNLEAAHIQPKAHSGTYLPCNGLALCRDMHWAFDKGFITIMDDYTIKVHDEVKNTILAELDGKKINLPKETYFQPEKSFLKHHRENIFGLFINSGCIRAN